MKYVSTRGSSPPRSFGEILLSGLAPDGGLFMPEAWPQLSPAEIAALARGSYVDAACAIVSRFTGGDVSPADLREDISAAYASFDAPDIVPLAEIGRNAFLLELFHGPTLAFKDLAMQVLGRLFARALAKSGRRATVLVATSGDTGAAAIAALGGLKNIELFVLYPHGRISEVQRRQMTTVPHANVRSIAVEGTFDDAQAIVKALFGDADFAAKASLTAVNSINLARIIVQSVYYFTAAAKLGAAPVFVVPTGNFGDVFAGEAAARMGLGVEKLVIATNANDILARTLKEGVYAAGTAIPTLSPSMDIQVASNFERALFEACGRDSGWTAKAMQEFAADKRLVMPPKVMENLRSRYAAYSSNDAETTATIGAVYRESGRLIDPHTAVAVAAARKTAVMAKGPVVILSTAHPAKFPDAVEQATGLRPPLPRRLADLYDRPERTHILPAEAGAIRAYIEHELAG